jgi:diguanylate cyclase (GGDEF)-like protein
VRVDHPLLGRPQGGHRFAVAVAIVVATAGVGYLHLLSGLAYEFHLFFIVPVLCAAWIFGRREGYLVAMLAVALWYLADLRLGGEQGDPRPLLFNSAVRLAIFVAASWLLAHTRGLLERETRLAREDELTGLPNRREFFALGRIALATAQRQEAPLTAVFIDLDRFKEVNDERGHETGDRLLREVADGLRAHMRAADIAGRLGGDEFALLLPGMEPEAAADYVADLRHRLLAAMAAQRWPVTFSIGVASYRQPPDSLPALLAEADALMYAVKRGGRDRVEQRVLGGAVR